jgi:hypothetical protein
VAQQAGRHFGTAPFVRSTGDLPDSWLVAQPGRRLVVLVRAKGVIRIAGSGSMNLLQFLIWPFSWIVHWGCYRRLWSVEVVDIPDGFWRSAVAGDRLVHTRTVASHRQAMNERDGMVDRIDALGSPPNS